MPQGLTMERRETPCRVMTSVYFRKDVLRKCLSFSEKSSGYYYLIGAWSDLARILIRKSLSEAAWFAPCFSG